MFSMVAPASCGQGVVLPGEVVVGGTVPCGHQIRPRAIETVLICAGPRNVSTACPEVILQRMPLRFIRWVTSTRFAASTTPDPMPKALFASSA